MKFTQSNKSKETIDIKKTISLTDIDKYDQVTLKEKLKESTISHIEDVQKGIQHIIDTLTTAASKHDHTKLEFFDEFFQDFITKFDRTDWYDKIHTQQERHHLYNNCPDDVDLCDVLEQLVDGCMAGMARDGNYKYTEPDPAILLKAYRNTVSKLLARIQVHEDQ